MKKAILLIACITTFFFESYAQKKLMLLSYDTLRYNDVMEYYCLDSGQKVLDSTQAEYIKNLSIWAKKNFKGKRKNYFVFQMQSNIAVGDSERLATYDLVIKEFLKNGLVERQIKKFDYSDPTIPMYAWISGCPHGVIVKITPRIKKREYCDLRFCDH
jgi:hypothetical protein